MRKSKSHNICRYIFRISDAAPVWRGHRRDWAYPDTGESYRELYTEMAPEI